MNHEKVLVDTSAWILSFKKGGNLKLKEFLKKTVRADLASTSPIIILELVQGCRTKEEQDALRIRLESLDVFSITKSIWERAYELAFLLRRKELTVPTVDLIIATIAIENNLLLLHQDRHFEIIASTYPDLKTQHFSLKP